MSNAHTLNVYAIKLCVSLHTLSKDAVTPGTLARANKALKGRMSNTTDYSICRHKAKLKG